MYAVKKILQKLLTFAETEKLDLEPGVLRDRAGSPLLDMPLLTTAQRREAFELTNALLSKISQGGHEALDSMINRCGLKCSIFTSQNAPGVLVPSMREPKDIPLAILALARVTPTGTGDSLLHRISLCQECDKFFLRKTQKKSRFCSKTCESTRISRDRSESGYYKKYRENRKPTSQ